MKLLTASVLVAIASVATFCGLALQKSRLTYLRQFYMTKSAKLTTLVFTTVTCIVVATFLFVVRAISPAPADNTEVGHLLQKLISVDGNVSDWFGSSVAMSGQTVLVGAPHNITAGIRGGAAYMFSVGQKNIQQSRKLIADDTVRAFGGFGSAVAVSGRVAIVGRPENGTFDPLSGSAYVYECDMNGRWNQIAKLQVSPSTGQRIGFSVAISSDYAVVGSIGTSGSGTAYVFERKGANDWRQVAKLRGESNNQDDRFGTTLAISGNRIVIGARTDSSIAPQAGAVFIFQRDVAGDWNKTAKLTARPSTKRGDFGSCLAISDDLVVVGAPGEGAAYLFQEHESRNWREVVKLIPASNSRIVGFASAVAINGGTIAVGSPVQNRSSGAVYLFKQLRGGQWRQIAELTHPFQQQSTSFGSSIALSGNTLLAGARGDDGGSATSGAVYLYRFRGN